MSGSETDPEEFARALERRMSAPKWKPGGYCDRCNNTGEVDCHCGGDLCVCGEQELECPQCHGASNNIDHGADYSDPFGGEAHD